VGSNSQLTASFILAALPHQLGQVNWLLLVEAHDQARVVLVELSARSS
jgi:hypothetical protein